MRCQNPLKLFCIPPPQIPPPVLEGSITGKQVLGCVGIVLGGLLIAVIWMFLVHARDGKLYKQYGQPDPSPIRVLD